MNRTTVQRRPGRAGTVVIAAVMLMAIALLQPSPAHAASSPAASESAAAAATASDRGPVGTGGRSVGAEHYGIPSLTTLRSCMRTVVTLGGCVAGYVIKTCATGFTQLLKCGRRIYSVAKQAKKIQQYRESSACPAALGGLSDYVCDYRTPPALRTVTVLVSTNGLMAQAYTGPANYYPLLAEYAHGTPLSVYCVTPYGQPISVLGRPPNPLWSRLSNGLFLPHAALATVPGQPLSTVPEC